MTIIAMHSAGDATAPCEGWSYADGYDGGHAKRVAQGHAKAIALGYSKGDAEAFARNYAKGVVQERARMRSIIESPHAEYRQGLALHLATETDLTPVAAEQVLASAPAEGATPAALGSAVAALYNQRMGIRPVAPLANAMASAPAGRATTFALSEADMAAAPHDGNARSEGALAASVVDLYRQATGAKH